jgi:parvulin-like peptidyl-prolyl isomerase
VGRALSAAARATLAIAITASMLPACGGARVRPRSEEARRADASSGDTPASPTTAPDAITAARSEDPTSTVASPSPSPARVRVRAIRVTIGARSRDAALERATMLARAARADDFSQLAAEFGDGEGAAALGAGGVSVSREADGSLPDPVRDAALALDLREVSRPVEHESAFWILQRVE